jgi:hypothetical protein
MARQVHTSIEASLLRQLRDEVHRRLAPYRHIALLAAVIVALLVRPLVGHNEACLILISLGDVAAPYAEPLGRALYRLAHDKPVDAALHAIGQDELERCEVERPTSESDHRTAGPVPKSEGSRLQLITRPAGAPRPW